MVSNFINRSISFFTNKKKLLIISLSIIILFIVGFIYRSYATSTGVALGNQENTYDILLTDSTNTVEVPARSSKTVYYQFSNTNKGTVKYHIGYISDNCTAKVWWDTEDPISGTIEYGEYKFIKLKLINESTSNDTITIKPVLGFVNGGDLVVPSDITLVTNTINEVNTMSVTPTDALTTLGMDKANVKELSFVNDNIPSSDSLGSTNMNSDGTIKLWYTNSDTNGLYNVYIGSDNGISTFPKDSNYYLSGFTKLTNISLNNIDTSSVDNMTGMFYNCVMLTSLDLSNFNTSNVTKMNLMFNDCKALQYLDLSSFNTSKVIMMNQMFSHCHALESLNISNFDTSVVKNMKYMFNQCRKLTYLDVRNFDTSSVTNMLGMFCDCRSLTYLDVSHFDTSLVTDMSEMFHNCQKITVLDVSGFNTKNVTTMASMFNNCMSIKSLDVSNFNTSKVTTMNQMFSGCFNLETINLSNFNTSLVTNMSEMFYQCEKLKSLDLSNFNTKKVTNMASMFSYCNSIENIIFGDDYSLMSLVENNNENELSGIPNMFYECLNITDDTINGILKIFSTAGSGIQTKTLLKANMRYSQATTATTLSNYQLFTDAGWTTGY